MIDEAFRVTEGETPAKDEHVPTTTQNIVRDEISEVS